jgi:hypothetical protein
LREETGRDYAELARLGHVTRARMTQIMKLLDLAPDLQEKILFLPPVVQYCSGFDTSILVFGRKSLVSYHMVAYQNAFLNILSNAGIGSLIANVTGQRGEHCQRQAMRFPRNSGTQTIVNTQ